MSGENLNTCHETTDGCSSDQEKWARPIAKLTEPEVNQAVKGGQIWFISTPRRAQKSSAVRIRTLKPEFWQDESLATVSRDARLVAVALLNAADDEGYFKSHPAIVAGMLFPFENDAVRLVEVALSQLSSIGYVEILKNGVGRIPGFKKHQRINRPTESRLKAKSNEVKENTSTENYSNPENKGTEFSEDSVSAHGTLIDCSVRNPEMFLLEVGRSFVLENQNMSDSQKPESDELRIFLHWQQVFKKNKKTVFDKKRRKAVLGRLADGYSVDDICRAIDGCAKTPFNLGTNETGQVYTDLELICRNASNIERFMENQERPPVKPTKKNFDIMGAENVSDPW